MANKLAIVTGNFTTAGTWVSANTGTNAVLISTSSSTTALTTSNLDSATFVPAAQQSQYLAIRVASRAAGSPTNKMTVILRNSTTATNVTGWTFVMNVSDIPQCDTANDQGGWLIFKASSTVTPNGTDSYVVRVTVDSTSTAVALSTNGTANNWQRQLFQTATGAPAAGDDMLIGGNFSTANPAVMTAVTVTMDQTAATDYGSNTTNYRTAALNICKGGTLTFGTSASTNYVLQLSGFLEVYSGGTLNQGTSGAPVPRTSTAVLQLDPATDVAMGIEVRSGATRNLYGQSALSGVSNTWCLLTADLAAAGTSATVNRQLAAKSGDTVVIAPTDTTRSHQDLVTLNADATSTTLAWTGGVTNAHTGTNGKQAEAIVVNRNVRVTSVTSTLMTFEYWLTGSTTAAQWAEWRYCGQGTTIAGLRINNTGSTLDSCSFNTSDGDALYLNASSASTTVQHCVFYLINGSTANTPFVDVVTGATGVSFTDNVSITTVGTGVGFVFVETPGPSITAFSDNRCAGFSGSAFQFGQASSAQQDVTGGGLTFSNLTAHTGTSATGFKIASLVHLNLTNLTSWNNDTGLSFFGGCKRIDITNLISWGDTCGVLLGSTTVTSGGVTAATQTRFLGGVIAGATYGVSAQNGGCSTVVFDGTAFGSTAGGYYTDNTKDFNSQNATNLVDLYDVTFRGCTYTQSMSSSWHPNFFSTTGSVLRWQDSTNKLVDYKNIGVVAYETTTVDASPSVRMTPASATTKLDTTALTLGLGWYVPVDNGGAPTVSIKIQKDASYNGNAPRLMLRANGALGVTADTVLGTFSGSSGSFQTVSGTCPAATDQGVYEIYVDCDGTAGNIFVDTFTVTGAGASAISGLKYWFNGLPC